MKKRSVILSLAAPVITIGSSFKAVSRFNNRTKMWVLTNSASGACVQCKSIWSKPVGGSHILTCLTVGGLGNFGARNSKTFFRTNTCGNSSARTNVTKTW